MKGKKKRGSSEFLLPGVGDIKTLVQGVSKQVGSQMKIFSKQWDAIRKTLTKYEEPYSQVYQNYKGMHIEVTLPEVKKKDVTLKITDTSIEIQGMCSYIDENRKRQFKAYHRLVDLPPQSMPTRTRANYTKTNKLKIFVPYEKLE